MSQPIRFLQAVVAVKAAPALSELCDPRPDLGRGTVDCDGAGRRQVGITDEIVTRQRLADLVRGGAPAQELGSTEYSAGAESGDARAHRESLSCSSMYPFGGEDPCASWHGSQLSPTCSKSHAGSGQCRVAPSRVSRHPRPASRMGHAASLSSAERVTWPDWRNHYRPEPSWGAGDGNPCSDGGSGTT